MQKNSLTRYARLKFVKNKVPSQGLSVSVRISFQKRGKPIFKAVIKIVASVNKIRGGLR